MIIARLAGEKCQAGQKRRRLCVAQGIVNVQEGSKVEKGDLLFRLDDADLQAQLERFLQQEKVFEWDHRETV